MKPPKDPVYMARQLERAYQMRDAFEAGWLELQAEGAATIEDQIAAASVRQTVEAWIAYYHRELRILARHGGHGHRVQGAYAGRGAQKDRQGVRARPAHFSKEITR